MTQSDKSKQSSGRQVMRAAGIVAVAGLLRSVVGLVRNMIKASYLGLGAGATAFDTASQFPEAIFLILAGGAIGSAFIPTFAAYFVRDDEAGGWRLFSTIINLVTIVITAVAILTIIFAEPFVQFFLHAQVEADPMLFDLTVKLMRIMLISPIIFGASGVIMAALNARQHFLLPAIAPIILHLGVISGAILGDPPEIGMAWGMVIGAVGFFLIQLPGLKQQNARYTAVLTLRDPGVTQVLRLMAPRILGLSFSEINKFATVWLSGFISAQSIPALITALQLMRMPQQIIGQALGIAAFPTLATLAAKSAYDEMRQILSNSLRLLFFLGLPITVLLMLLSTPFVTILYERGIFGAEETELVAWALLFYALGLIALSVLEVIARAFYSLGDTLTPVLAGGLQAVAMVVLGWWFSSQLFPLWGLAPFGGIALAFSLSNYVEILILFWLLRRKMGSLNGRSLLDGFWRMGIASGLMAIAISLTQFSINAWGQAIIGTLIGGVVYLLVCALLRVKEVEQFLTYGRHLLNRFTKS